MRLSPWTRYLAASLAACALYLLSPRGTTLQTVWATAIGVLAGLAILDGVRPHRPPAALAWLLFAVGIAANALGQSVEAYVTEVLRVEDPFPGVADAFYLALYP